MASAQGAHGLLGQIGQIWSMLDDLSENDPAGYRSLLQAQAQAQAQAAAELQLRWALRSEPLEPGRGPLYINVCSWSQVPAPQGPSIPVPVCAGELETSTDEGRGRYMVLDVALNPAVLRDSSVDVRALAVRFAQKRCGVRLSQDYTVVACSPNSSPDEISRRLRLRQKPDVCEQPAGVSQTPADLLRQISSFNAGKEDEGAAAAAIPGPAESRSTGLIQVISSVDAQPQVPPHRLQLKADGAGGARRVLLTAELPKVSSVSECQLRISKDDVLLEVEGLYHLRLDFPAAVDEDTATAVFNRKKRTLAVTVDAL